jgi:hypothetical protein
VSVYEGIHCRLAVEAPAAGIVVVRLTGWDVGEFGAAPMHEIDRHMQPGLQLFIDARQVRGATVDVSNDWALWLRANRERLAHISMLTGGPFVQLTAKFVRRFAGLDDVMRVYTEASAFDAALAAAIGGASAPAAQRPARFFDGR